MQQCVEIFSPWIAVGTDEDGEDEEKADVVINIKELDDVLMKDVGNHIATSGK